MMLVSCILPTYNRREFLPASIGYFLKQDYGERELIIVDDGTDAIQDLVPQDDRIRYFRLDTRHRVGAKRNFACREARGEVILHWDDDDWMADWRISYQVRELLDSGKEICGLDRLDYFEPATGKAWEYAYPEERRPWVAGNTLCYRRRFWEQHPFADVQVAEDARFVWQAQTEQVLRLEDKRFFIGIVHRDNVSRKDTAGNFWRAIDAGPLRNRMAGTKSGVALVAAGCGIGDILRITPLVRVLHRLGYEVDLFLKPDFSETVDLLRGAPEVRHIWTDPPKEQHYDVAVFSTWAVPFLSQVDATRKLKFKQAEWLQRGDSFCVEKLSRELGWEGTMPPPFALASNRDFHLPPNTVALHPGCKPDWPWKKWHGFDELARLLPHVALIGTAADLDNGRTYFARPFQWPANVMNFVGKLSLTDTAALIKQCAALVANDSGMMHLGAALGVPTIGVFGITNPDREGVPARNLFPMTKGLSCEPACRRQPWGRRDCEHHLQCLKELIAPEVKAQLDRIAPKTSGGSVKKLRVAYHGHVFDASGYGNAARAYIHALHAAGVELSVSDLSGHPRQVSDSLVESLVGPTTEPDFQLFHGIPHTWATRAFRVRNGVAMTVWETDTMPTQWRNTLNHMLETWLPCDFNVAAFRANVPRVAKLPHPVAPRCGGQNLPNAIEFLRTDAAEFVVYSIFEWQDRKSPAQQIRAFLKAFSSRDCAVFILKTNPGADSLAERALAEARAETGSDARVELRAQAWNDAEIEALHARGDCYLSLHRGEGWCYPLFDAACAGVPVVATAYSGPLEYLDPDHHQLVPYSLTSVQQRYAYYHPRMRWADPDVDGAAARLRWVYNHRDEARGKAQAAASAIKRRYSSDQIGQMAKRRLLDLLRQTNPARHRQLMPSEENMVPLPQSPIPGEWYDADYFEYGRKSNWSNGYDWRRFELLFNEMAAYLASMFPVAQSFLDAGCAKGFLVKALRAASKDTWGFDHSPWAIANAADDVRPFLELAGVDDYEFTSPVDVLVCFDLFPHLTEDQIDSFLDRAKPHVRVAIVALIDTYAECDEIRAGDRDISHITRRTRPWWSERFRQSGWQQRALCLNLQSLCQQHELPRRMGWQVYVYTPE